MTEDSDVQKIKDRVSIVDVVGQYVKLRRAGRNWSGLCPFHKEKTPSFMVSPERGTYICFGCGEKGDIFSFVQKMDGLDFAAALRQLAEKADVKLSPRSSAREAAAPEHKEKEARLRDVCEEAVKFFQEQLAERKDAAEYIRARGVHDETTASWRLGYAPASWESLCKHLLAKGVSKGDLVDAGFAVQSQKKAGEVFDRFRGRIIFPIFDLAGNPIAVSGRFFEKVPGSAEESEPAKYVNSPETALFKKSRTLYGLDRAKNFIRKADCILMVEGQFDVVLSHQSGLPITVALSGTALTAEHLSLLSRFSKRLVLALDADEAGIRAGLKSAYMALSAGFDVKIPTFPEGKDPADMARENPELLKAAVRTSKTAVEFFLDVLRRGARDERAYKKLVEAQVLPLIAAIGSAIDREHFIRLTASRLMTSEAAVRSEVSKAKNEGPDFAFEPEHEAPVQTPMMLSPLERNAGMLLTRFKNDEAMRGRVHELLGEERLVVLEAKLQNKDEELLFAFDALGEDAQAVAGELLEQLERLVLEEEMKRLRERLYRGDEDGSVAAKQLAVLKRRQQELRK